MKNQKFTEECKSIFDTRSNHDQNLNLGFEVDGEGVNIFRTDAEHVRIEALHCNDQMSITMHSANGGEASFNVPIPSAWFALDAMIRALDFDSKNPCTHKRTRKVVIHHCPDPHESPRDWDNLGKMVYWHRRYTLGDENPKMSPEEYRETIPEGSVVMPLYLLDHSGLALRTTPFTSRWDSGQVGLVYATPEDIEKSYTEGTEEEIQEKVKRCLKAEVKIYDQYLRGQVWGYTIEEVCEECDQSDRTGDSCWGFFGDDLEETGITEYIPEELHEQLEDAWHNRHE